MSSQPSNERPARKRVPFEQWRKVMLLGALVLLANALADALMDGTPPRWISLLLAFVGYGFLAVGFGIRMRSIKEARAKAIEDQKTGTVEEEG